MEQVHQIIERKSIQGVSPEAKNHNKSHSFYHRTCHSAQNLLTPNTSTKKRNKTLLFNSAKHQRNAPVDP